jgi:antitoxin VapB
MSAMIKAFKSGNSVAVRLPKELGIVEGTELEIVETASGWLLRRKPKYSGKDLVEALEKLPKLEKPWKREKIIFPERNWG